MKPIPQISEAELAVMKVLWLEGQATSSLIIERLSDTTDWKPKTIQTLITRLAAKEAISSEKINGKTYQYFPAVTEEEYKKSANQSFLQKVYNGSVRLMLTSFIQEHKLTREDMDELKKLLDKEE